jgi:hypothetical protein
MNALKSRLLSGICASNETIARYSAMPTTLADINMKVIMIPSFFRTYVRI